MGQGPSVPLHPLETPALSRRFLLLFPVAASIWYIAFFIVVAAMRASFPMQLEWVESGILDTVARPLAHLPIYVAPTHLFVPYLYTPLYFHVGAWLCRIFGLNYAPLRWLSIVCTLGCFGLIYEQTRAFTASRRAGLVAAGAFAALYGASRGVYDIARIDMLYMVLLLAAIHAVWRNRPLLAGLLFACSYQSKQGAAIVAVFVLASHFRRPWRCLVGMGTFAAVAVASVVWMNRASVGWYGFYTLWLPSHQPLDMMGVFYFAARDIGRYLLPGLLLIGLVAQKHLGQMRNDPRVPLLLFGAIGSFCTSLAGRAHSGGWPNATLPFYAWFAVLFGVAVHHHFASYGDSRGISRGLTAALISVQFLISFVSPSHFVPSHAQRWQAHQFLQQMAAVPGDIFVINAATDLSPLHRNSFANGVPVWDILRAGDSAARRSLVEDLQRCIHERQYTALLSPYAPGDLRRTVLWAPDFSRDYRLDVPPLETGEAASDLKIIQTPQIGPVYLFPVRK